MHGDFCGIVVNEVSNPVMGDAPELGPLAQRANRWFFACREYPAQAQAEDVRELVLTR